jgi:hypothetical protein
MSATFDVGRARALQMRRGPAVTSYLDDRPVAR